MRWLLLLSVISCGHSNVSYDAGLPCQFEWEDGAQFAESTVDWITPKCLPDGGFYEGN